MANLTDYRANIEQILLGYYIRYNTLDQLTKETFGNSDDNMIDVYIDLYDMLLPLYTTNIYANKQFTIVSAVINLAAHIREFYWSRYRVNTRIYLVYADNTSMNHKQFYYKFGNDIIKGMMNYEKINSVIQTQLEMVKILCAYIYGVYYIRRTTDFSMFTLNSIMQNKPVKAVVLTKSKYAYQLPAICDCVIFRPKKYNGEDVSYVINRNNVLFKYFNKTTNEKTLERLKCINPSLLSLLISLTGLPEKKLLTLFNSTTAISKLYNAVTSNVLINDYNTDIDYAYDRLDIGGKIDPVNFKYRFNAVDLIFQHRIYNNMAEARDISWQIDLQDKETVQYINNRYFYDNPLNLDAL